MKRIVRFFNDLEDAGMTNYDIMAGLTNGDIKKPEWMAISEGADHLKAWDVDDKAADGNVILDAGGSPLTDGDVETIAVRNTIDK